jgi:glycosyltransferase involved in cell wall biosynthesis
LKAPLISVVIPALNRERALRACLGSVVGQCGVRTEIVVVDGLSSDGTIDVVRDFEASHPALRCLSERDAGIYDAINKGVRAARGDWIYVLGSDDRLFVPDTLQGVAAFLSRCHEDVVYGNVLVNGDAGWASDGRIWDGEFGLEKLLRQNVCQQAVFYRRSLFARIGHFNTDYRVCADWDFMLRCAARATLKYIDVIVAEFHGGGASKSAGQDGFDDDFARNLFEYFGPAVYGAEFRSVAWRFRKLAEAEAARGNSIAASFYRRVHDRLVS